MLKIKWDNNVSVRALSFEQSFLRCAFPKFSTEAAVLIICTCGVASAATPIICTGASAEEVHICRTCGAESVAAQVGDVGSVVEITRVGYAGSASEVA